MLSCLAAPWEQLILNEVDYAFPRIAKLRWE